MKRWLKCLSGILSFSVFFSMSPHVLLADETSAKFYSVTEDLTFEAETSIISSWENHANLDIAIKNTGIETIHNWFISFDLPYVVEGTWGSVLSDSDNAGVYTFKNAGWNQDILPGQIIHFGMTVSSSGDAEGEFPSFYLLNTIEKNVDSEDYLLNYQEYSNWGDGFTGSLVLINTSSETIEDWNLSFSTNRDILEVSGAVLSSSDTKVLISNDGASQNLNPKESFNMTIVGGTQNSANTLLIDEVTLTTVSVCFELNRDTDCNGVADYKDFMDKEDGNEDVVSDTELESEQTPTPTSKPDFEMDSDEDGIPDNYENQMGMNPNSKHSDEDGIEDGIELMLNFDPLSEDSDGDSIPDGQEDTDEDGLTILQEIELGTYTWTDDSDFDGISDGDEVSIYGSYPLKPDSDEDGIEDGDEVKLGMDPMNSDSDGDGISDAHERFAQVREESIINRERPEVTAIEVKLEGTGCLDTAMTIEDVYGKDFYSSDLLSLVGVPVEINYDGEFDEATITFHYDDALLSTDRMNLESSSFSGVFREEDLGILWYDEDSELYIDCNAIVNTEDNTVSCNTTHFSKYMLYWKVAWEYRWKYELQRHKFSATTNQSGNGQNLGIDYILMIQYDATMTEEQRDAQTEIVYQFIDNLGPNDRIQLFDWSDNWVFGPINSFSRWDPISDKQTLKYYYDRLTWDKEKSSGYDSCSFRDDLIDGGDVDWIFVAPHLSNRINFDDQHEIVSICFQNVLTQERSSQSELDFGLSKMCNWNYPSTYLFKLPGSMYDLGAQLIFNANSNGGIIDCELVDDPYEEFCRQYLLRQGIDTDGDGLWDLQEESGMVATNGEIYRSSTTTKYSDDDGLTDREEMGAEIKLVADQYGNITVDGSMIEDSDLRYKAFSRFGQGEWVVYSIYSDPLLPDSDFDGANDAEDATPWDKNKSISYLLYADSDLILEYESIIRYKNKIANGRIEAIEVLDYNDFFSQWNKMGENSSGLTEYQIDEVILVFHGSFNSIGPLMLQDIIRTPLNAGQSLYLERKTIKSLVLSSCDSGNISASDNVAREFMKWGTIGEVYAWNGTATFLGGGTFHAGFFDIHYTLETTWDDDYNAFLSTCAFLSEYVVCLLKTDQKGMESAMRKYIIDIGNYTMLGRVRYFINSEGDIDYEKVPFISCDVALALYSS